MSAKIKYNLDLYAEASNMAEAGFPWCCNLISEAALRIDGAPSWKCVERDLFEAVYDIKNPIYEGLTFQGIYRYHYPEESFPYNSELIEIRLLALALVREIARRKNRQGTHTARAKRRAEANAKKG
jgi:hypothetical protein